jgi:hypothetical protein
MPSFGGFCLYELSVFRWVAAARLHLYKTVLPASRLALTRWVKMSWVIGTFAEVVAQTAPRVCGPCAAPSLLHRIGRRRRRRRRRKYIQSKSDE